MDRQAVYDNIIVGSGPGGLNLALEFEQRGIPWIILEARNKVGGQFDQFPVCGELISLNKKNVLWDDYEYARRYDWHTLNGITEEHSKRDPKLLFTNWSDKLFPEARKYAEYLRYVCEAYKLTPRIHFNSRVGCISHRNGLFQLTLSSGQVYTAKRVFLGAGTSAPVMPNMKGLENTTFYKDFNPTALDQYRNKIVTIVGGGNSAFEIANCLVNVAAVVLVLSNSGFKFARQTHNVHDIRTQTAVIQDLAQLKSQMNTISDTIQEVSRMPNGRLLLKMKTPQPHWEKPVWTARQLVVDHVIICSGFLYTLPDVFADNVKPEVDQRGKFCKLTPMWESTNVKDLYFIGGAMRVNDLYAASGFVHGFRCNITALATYIAEKHYQQSLQPVFQCTLDLKDHETFKPLTSYCIDFVSRSTALFELFSFFNSTITLTKDPSSPSKYTASLYPPFPLNYSKERWSKDPSLEGRVEVVFRYGFDQYGKDIPTHYFTHASDHFNTKKSSYIHPVFYAYDHKRDRDTFVEEWHLQESLVARWDNDDYVDEGTNVHQYTNSVFNAVAAALGVSDRKDTKPVYPHYIDTAYPPMTNQEIEITMKREPYLKYFVNAKL